MTKTVVVALGGNSFISDETHQSVPDQYRAAERACAQMVPLLHDPDLRLVVTHGNGPQVGFILLRSEIAAPALHQVPLDSCVADTQGALGYQLERALRNELRRHGLARSPAAVVTLVLVDRDDPAFRNPTKPIGSFLSKERAEERRVKDGWDVVEDAGRGWRRVVASPVPKGIVDLDAVKCLLDAGFVVIAAGGGGIAVVEESNGDLTGASAVVDKDLASSLLAKQLGAEVLVITTGVEKVCLDFGKPTQRALDAMTVADAKRYMAEGHFKPGSMLPKVEAVVAFLEGGGKQAIITDPEHLVDALAGKTGTHVTL
ncbi:Carbamate kinase 1 [Rhodoplanes serenus]|jgi:carbamate kinase|uniref:Carbamate kinase n=1 Tax=Rhodoplanes serenus TaxID=200615 RepID=A0A3S4FFU8_9BRAD|nr:carbamate kinase [Rhodoplanes serenus]MBI5113946.1 carbamate kinase [Rhodovulum sp.]VCU11191.1 Carbamate kinase 1 [Rhodoplanes serenus]